MEIINKLANAFNLSTDEIYKKLNLSEDSDSKEIAKAIGVYRLFQDKPEIEGYIKTKVQNKTKEIEELTNNFNSLKQENDNLKTTNDKRLEQIKKVVGTELSKYTKDEKIVEEFDFNNFDFVNYKNQINDFVKAKDLKPLKIPPADTEDNDKTFSNKISGVNSAMFGASRTR